MPSDHASALAQGRRRFATLVPGALFAALAGATAAKTPFVLTTGAEEPWSTPDGRGFLNRLVREALGRLDLVGEVQMFTSSERALINAHQGIDDGVAMRIAGLEAQYPNLVRVNESIAVNDFVAIVPTSASPPVGWDDLQGRTVGFVNGWKIFEARLAEGPGVVKVRDADQLFSLLAAGRIDVALYERQQGLHKAAKHRVTAAAADPPLARVPMFLYLHRRHAALAPQLAHALAAMKRDGSYERIWRATMPAAARGGR